MKLYRVFEAYHVPDASGTIEYGIYSSHDAAMKRAYAIWDKKGWPVEGREEFSTGLLLFLDFEAYSIRIREYEIDRDIEDEITGYT